MKTRNQRRAGVLLGRARTKLRRSRRKSTKEGSMIGLEFVRGMHPKETRST